MPAPGPVVFRSRVGTSLVPLGGLSMLLDVCVFTAWASGVYLLAWVVWLLLARIARAWRR